MRRVARGCKMGIAVGSLLGLIACSFPHGKAAGTPDADVPTVPDAPDASTSPVSCASLHSVNPALPSGTYDIDPDGSGADAPLSVWCDMATDGGGWTLVFFASGASLYNSNVAYTSATPRLLADAQTALIAFRTSGRTIVGSHATFAMPSAWRIANPMTAPGTNVTTMVSVSGATPTSAVLQFGYQQFVSGCGDAWNTSSTNGRICIAGTTAPFYASFANASTDSCTNSQQSAGLVACGPERRFTIAVK